MISGLSVPIERLRRARPDAITHRNQLTAGQIAVGFSVYSDVEGIINRHMSTLAVIDTSAYRVRDPEIKRLSSVMGPFLLAEKLPTYVIENRNEPDNLYLAQLGIKDVCETCPPAGLTRGLLRVQPEPYATEESLMIGPGLYVNGANDIQMTICGFMAVALDSDPRLS